MTKEILKGELSELKFAVIAMEHGFNVCRPIFAARYDLILEKDGSLHRIQVKSTKTINKKKPSDWYGVSVSRGNKGKVMYSKKNIDYFAIHIKPLDIWYIVPVDDVTGVKMSLNPNSKKSKYTKFIDAWHLLD